jgi:hypothetical protein
MGPVTDEEFVCDGVSKDDDADDGKKGTCSSISVSI